MKISREMIQWFLKKTVRTGFAACTYTFQNLYALSSRQWMIKNLRNLICASGTYKLQKSLICRIDKKLLIFYFVHTHLKCLFSHGKDRICIREIVVKHLTQQSTGKKWCQTGFRLDAEQVIFGEIGIKHVADYNGMIFRSKRSRSEEQCTLFLIGYVQIFKHTQYFSGAEKDAGLIV